MSKKSDAQDLIDRVRTLRLAGDEEGAAALVPDAEAAVKACAPRDRKALAAALVVASETAPVDEEEKSPGSDLAITSYHDVEGVDEVVETGAEKVRQAVDTGMTAVDLSRQIAALLLTARLKMRNKAGLPDVISSSKYTKNIAADMYKKAREGIAPDDVHRWATHGSLEKAVRNRMSDVVVDLLRSLDAEPERFPKEALDQARARFPKLSPTEAVYALYEEEGFALPRKGRTELAREDARKRAAMIEAAKRGELPDDDETGDDVSAEIEAVERLERSLTRIAHRAEERPAAEKAKLKARINEVIASLAAQASRL